MPALEAFNQLMGELKNTEDQSLPSEVKEKLTEIFKALPKEEERVNHHELRTELLEIVEKFEVEHQGITDFVNVLSNMGV